VLLANDGHEALRLIDAYQPLQEQIAVVLLDLMLPAVSGRDVLTYLRTHGGAETPVVVISANEPLLSHAADWGANAAVPKPFKLHDLLMTVEACCSVSA
jgi:DNA-binding response OmpR family regulator